MHVHHITILAGTLQRILHNCIDANLAMHIQLATIISELANQVARIAYCDIPCGTFWDYEHSS